MAHPVRQCSVALTAMPLSSMLSNLDVALVALAGGYLSLRGTIDVGTVASFFIFARTFSRPLNQFAQILNMALQARAGASRVFEILELRDGVPGAHGYIVARPLPGAAPSRAEVERIDPADTREHAALAHNIRQLHRAGAELEASVRAEYEQSRSWRLTAPLRKLAAVRRA